MKVVIICELDAYANALRPGKLAQYIRARGHQANIYETPTLSRAGRQGIAASLPGLSLFQMTLYLLEAGDFLARRLGNKQLIRIVRSLVIRPMMRMRSRILSKKLRGSDYDVIICDTNLDIGFTQCDELKQLKILDLSVPNAEELYFGGSLRRRAFEALRSYEAELYAAADYVSFGWSTYTEYVKRHKYNGPNIITLSYGVDPRPQRAYYSPNPRIVFLGSLGGAWVNVPLLERLCRVYPNIDIYGGPVQKGLEDNYKGYAPTTDILAEYQFGLITITDDPLRRNSFSSKQLEYYAYGLPVLSPDWRADNILDKAALLYNEGNFLSLIDAHKDRAKWERVSSEALAIAQTCTWDRAFDPLGKILGEQRGGSLEK